MAVSDTGLAADKLADDLSLSERVKGVYIMTESDMIDIINALRSCANEIDEYVNGGM